MPETLVCGNIKFMQIFAGSTSLARRRQMTVGCFNPTASVTTIAALRGFLAIARLFVLLSKSGRGNVIG